MKHSQHAMQFVFLAAAAVVSAAFFSITFDIIIWLGSEQQQKTSPHINSLVPITGLITNILGCHHSLRFCHWFISSFSFPTLIPYIFVTYVFCCGCCRCRLDFDLVGGIRFFFQSESLLFVRFHFCSSKLPQINCQWNRSFLWPYRVSSADAQHNNTGKNLQNMEKLSGCITNALKVDRKTEGNKDCKMHTWQKENKKRNRGKTNNKRRRGRIFKNRFIESIRISRASWRNGNQYSALLSLQQQTSKMQQHNHDNRTRTH